MMNNCVDMFSVFNVFVLLINSFDWKEIKWENERMREREGKIGKQTNSIEHGYWQLLNGKHINVAREICHCHCFICYSQFD